MRNRISEHFADSPADQELLQAISDEVWQRVIDKTLELWYGPCDTTGREDFFFGNIGRN